MNQAKTRQARTRTTWWKGSEGVKKDIKRRKWWARDTHRKHTPDETGSSQTISTHHKHTGILTGSAFKHYCSTKPHSQTNCLSCAIKSAFSVLCLEVTLQIWGFTMFCSCESVRFRCHITSDLISGNCTSKTCCDYPSQLINVDM